MKDGLVSRNAWIDVLRGLAACAVVLFHFFCIPPEGTIGGVGKAWRTVGSYGHLGVAVFFVISGYCVMLTWARSDGWRDFAYRRVRRIFPAYYASLFLILVLASAIRLTSGVWQFPIPKDAGAVLATLVLATSPVTDVATLNWVYWSLSCEVAFYLIMTGLLVHSERRLRDVWFCVLHGVLCALALTPWIPVRGPLFFVQYWPAFGLGAALACRLRVPRLGASMLAISGLHAAVALAIASPQTSASLEGANRDGYLPTVILTAIWIVVSERTPFPPCLEFLRSIGESSYSLYLIHIPLGISFIERLLPRTYPGDALFLAQQLVVFLALLGLARLFFVVAERPFMSTTRQAAK